MNKQDKILTRNNRLYFWARKIIYKKGGQREKNILNGNNLRMYNNNSCIKVVSDAGVCYVYIPAFKENECYICG